MSYNSSIINGKVYLNDGKENIDGSVRFGVDPEAGIAEVERRVLGTWMPSSIEIGPDSLWVGRNVKVGGVGHHLATETGENHHHFFPYNEFDGSTTIKDTKILFVESRVPRLVYQPNNTGLFTGTLLEYLLPSPAHILAKTIYYQTGPTAATAPIRIQIWEGTDATGSKIFDQSYHASEFPADTEITTLYNGHVEYDAGVTYFVRTSSDAAFSLKTEATNSIPWIAADTLIIREDDVFTTTAYAAGRTYTTGDWLADSRKLYIANTTGVQSGTFASNASKWDLLSHSGDNYWTATGSQVSNKTGYTSFIFKDATRNRITAHAGGTELINPDGTFKIGATDGLAYFADTSRNRIFMDTNETELVGPNGTKTLTINNTNTTVVGDLIATLGSTSILADGVTGTTQADENNSTKVATTAYVDAHSSGHTLNGMWTRTGTTLNPTNAGDAVTTTGNITATSFLGELNGTINTATTAVTQSDEDGSTKVATTAYVDTHSSGHTLNGMWTRTGSVLNPTNAGDAVTTTGNMTATSFLGELTGTINTATTAVTQTNHDNSTKVATTYYVDNHTSGHTINGLWTKTGTIISPTTSSDTVITADINTTTSLYQPAFKDDTALIIDIPMESVGTTNQYSRGTKNNILTSINGAIVGANTGPYGGGAVYFDGLNDKLQTNTINGITMDATQKLTVECRAKSVDVSLANSMWCIQGSNNPNWQSMALGPKSSTEVRLTFGDGVDASGAYVDGTVSGSITDWHKYTATLDRVAQTMTLWIDGELKGTVSIAAESAAYAAPVALSIGSAPNSTYDVTHWDGWLTRFKVYDRVLANDEIRTPYLRGGDSLVRADAFRVMGTDDVIKFEVDDEFSYVGATKAKTTVSSSYTQLTPVEYTVHDGTRNRIFISTGETEIMSPDGQTNVSTDNSGVYLTSRGFSAIEAHASSTKLWAPDQNSSTTIKNTYTEIESPIVSFNDGTRDRVRSDTADTRLVSPSGDSTLVISNTATTITDLGFHVSDGTRSRFSMNTGTTKQVSPDGAYEMITSNAGITFLRGAGTRLSVNGTGSSLLSENLTVGLSMDNSGNSMMGDLDLVGDLVAIGNLQKSLAIFNIEKFLNFNPATTTTKHTQYVGTFSVWGGSVEIEIIDGGVNHGAGNVFRITRHYGDKATVEMANMGTWVGDYTFFYRETTSSELYELFFMNNSAMNNTINHTVHVNYPSLIGETLSAANDTNILPCDVGLVTRGKSANVGVGTMSPASKFHMYDAEDGSDWRFNASTFDYPYITIGGPSVSIACVYLRKEPTSTFYYGSTTDTGGHKFRGAKGTTTEGPLSPGSMTTSERDALTAVNGMIIYNTTTNTFNFYKNGAWVTPLFS